MLLTRKSNQKLGFTRIIKLNWITITKQYKSYLAKREIISWKTNVNTLKEIKRDAFLDENENRSSSGSAIPILVPKHTNTDIKIVLDTCQNSQQIVSLIKRKENEIIHASIYGKAMQKCRKLRDFVAVQHIMDLLLKRDDLEKSIVEFSIYINSMSMTEFSHRCIYYLQIMIKKYNIKPNEILFASLLKSFRSKFEWKEAEKIWNLMINEYKIEANEAAYSAMMAIYSSSKQKNKATKLLKEYINKYPNNKHGHQAIIGSYINLYCKLGDIKQIKKIIKLSTKKYGLKLTNELIASIMTCYYTNRKYYKIIKLYNKWINDKNNNNIPNRHLLFMKCVSLSHLIRSCNHGFEEKQKIYHQLINTLYVDLNKYGIRLDQTFAKIHLNAAIFLYHNQNPQEIVKVFEQLSNENLIGYLTNSQTLQIIDLHVFEFVTAQFILRYIFAYKLNKIFNDNCNRICIITGKGKHTWTNDKGNEQLSLYKFIVKELSSWKPPLILPNTSKLGRIYIHKHQLSEYLNNTDNNNYAKHLLEIPSNDWYNFESF